MLDELTIFLRDIYSLTIGYLFNTEKRIYWFYLLTSLALGVFVYFKSKSKKNIFSFLFPKKNFYSQTAFVDLVFLFFNAAVKIAIITSFSYYSKQYQFEIKELLLESYGLPSKEYSIIFLSTSYIICFFFINDFTYYLLHLLYHKVPYFWAFHKVHHSSTALNPLTQYRIHPVELIINNLRIIFLLTIFNSLFDYLNRGYFSPKTYYGVSIIVLSFNTWGANLRHSHIKLTYFNWLENILISPFQHQIHHSSQSELHDKNMGSKLAIWDKLFGTLVKSNEVEELQVGLGKKDKHYKTFWQNLINPFRSIFNSKF